MKSLQCYLILHIGDIKSMTEKLLPPHFFIARDAKKQTSEKICEMKQAKRNVMKQFSKSNSAPERISAIKGRRDKDYATKPLFS